MTKTDTTFIFMLQAHLTGRLTVRKSRQRANILWMSPLGRSTLSLTVLQRTKYISVSILRNKLSQTDLTGLAVVNLGGYTKGTRNEIFATRPCPIQILLMGFAGTLAAGWCDYLICDPVSCPSDLRPGEPSSERCANGLYIGNEADPESLSDDWI